MHQNKCMAKIKS